MDSTTTPAHSSAPLLEVPSGSLQVGAPLPAALALSLVIPTYNERANLRELLERLTATIADVLADRFELIVVDDESPDRTWELAQEIAANNPRVAVMRRRGERGLASAVIRGWQVAHGEWLAAIDADLQHPPEVMAQLCAAMQQADVDLVVASRHVVGGSTGDWNLARRAASRFAGLVGRVLLPGIVSRVTDPMSGYFAVRRAAIQEIELKPRGYKIQLEVLARGRIRGIREIGYTFVSRKGGESKAGLGVFFQYIAQLVSLRFARRGGGS